MTMGRGVVSTFGGKYLQAVDFGASGALGGVGDKERDRGRGN